MTIEELEAFVAAARSDSFYMADGSSHRFESSASDEILSLEKELGVLLFIREGISTGKLTEAGEALLEEAVSLIQQYRHTLRRMDTFRRSDTRPITIGSLPVLKQYRLRRIFSRFQDEHPEADIRIEETNPKALLTGLQEEYYDGIIIHRRLLTGLNLSVIPLASDEMAIIVPEDHPLAEEPSVRADNLKNEQFFMANPKSAAFDRGTLILKVHGIPQDHISIMDPDQIFDTIAAHKGISLLPISALNVYKHQEIVAVPFKPREGIEIVFATRPDVMKSRNVEDLIDSIQLRARTLPI